MKVSDQGFVSLDIERMSEAERRAVHHDPGYREAVQSWQDRINKAVQDVTDADAGVRIALQAVVIDESVIAGGRGFNGEARSDVEKYEGQAAEEALKKLGRGDRLTDEELAELRRTFRDNGDDPAFSRTLLDGLGATGTIKLTNELNDLIHVQGGDRVRDYSTIETGLANALASATRDTKSPWYEDWREDMRKAGVERHATDVQGARLDKAVGYQSLVSLMQKGHGYAPEMLGDLTDDMITAEKKDPGIWQLKHEYAGKGNGWFANDPVDGMLGIMSRDPDAAARYLSSGDNMRYLIKERDWDVTLHEHEGAKASTYTPGEDADTRAGFGAALQAAATGIDPSDENARYVEHTKQNEAVLKSAITLFADSGDDFPPSLREPMANVLINHGETVHRSMSSIAIAESPIDQTDLFEVSKQISKDSDAYSTLNGGLNQAMVADIHDDGPKGSTESLDRAGRTIGFLEEARVQAAGDPEKPEVEGKALVDRAISHIPVISSDVQAGFDYVTEKWLEDEQRRLEDQTTAQNIAEYTSRNGQLMALAKEWQATHESPPRDPYDIQKQINESTEDGIKHAQGVSGKSAT